MVKETVLRSVGESRVGSIPTARIHFLLGPLHPGEPNQVGTDAETRTCASRCADAGRVDIQDGKRGRGNQGNHANLGDLERLARQHKRGNGDREALQEVLHESDNEVGHINTGRGGGLRLRIHLFSSMIRRFFTHHPNTPCRK